MMKKEFLLKLTPYQEVFYDNWKLNPLKGDPHIILDQTFSGTIDIERLNISLVRFVNHNLLVNSNIVKVDGELFWKSKVQLSDTTPLLVSLPNQTDYEELLKLVLKPFDLENDLLSRFYIIKQDDGKYRIIYVFSSILIDRLTDNFLHSELSKYYNNSSYDNPVSLFEQAHLLNEMNKEVRTILNNGKEVIADFWKRHLTSIENPGFKFLEVYNKSVSDYSSFNEINFEFSKEILSKTNLLTETYKLTPYAYGQLVLAILLHRISEVNHLIINYPVSIKKQQNYILGSHVNTTVKGYYFSSDSRLKDLIKQNMEYLDSLWNTKADYLPILDLMKYAPRPDILEFNFSQTSFKDLFIDYHGIADITVNDELSLNAVDMISMEQEVKNEILYFKIIYNSSQLNPELIINFIELYKNLFICILDDLLDNKTNRLISDYHLLNYEMHHRVVSSQNDTIKYYDKEATIHGLFEEQALWTPEHTALVSGDVRLSYRDLNEKANQLAHYLIQHYDIRPDELIPICFNRSEKMLIGILGILKAGGAYVPLDPGYPVERLGHILNDTGARLILAEEQTVSKLHEYVSAIAKKGPAILNLDDADAADGIQKYFRKNPVTEVRSNHLAYVIYTSGTTGMPKGVMIEHSGVVNLVSFMTRSHRFNEYTNVGCYSNYVFDAFVNEVFPVLCHGNTLWLFSNEQRTSVADLNHYIKANGIEVSFIPPVLLKDLLVDTELKLIFAGGESFPDIDRSCYKDIIFLNEYGPTETTVCATVHHYDEEGNPLNIGRPIDNVSVYVLDSYLRPVPIGAVGELYVGGVGVSRGYLNLPELTAERFLANPFQTEEEQVLGYNGRIYKTGDLVRILPNGDLEYLGRNDSQIKIRGYRIEQGEIETALLGLNGIRQAVVECRENSMGLKYLAAYYVSENPLDSGDISVLLSEVLPDYMVPSAYVHLKALPVTINGKIDRKALPEPLFTGETEYVSPQTPLQEQLVEIYGEVLGLDADHISIHDDFFRLGGNSIMAIKLVNKIYQRTGIQATGGVVFNHKSIAGLSRALEGLPEFAVEEISPVIVKHTREQYLSFGQERLWFIENYEGGSHVYNIPMVLRLDNETNINFLQEAFHMLLDRHEVLRTLILTDPNGGGYQYVSDQSLELTLVEIGSFEDFMQVISGELNERFNLQEDLPIRVKVLDYEGDYYLSVVIHHIAFDGWSIEIFLRELNSIYQSLVLGVLPTLPSLPFQYKDFALWHRKYVTEKVLDKQLEYWLCELSEFETLNLPLDFQRPSRMSYEGETLYFSISPETSSQLRSMSKDLGVSLYSLMLSGYYLVLASYSGQDDLIVGTPVANRHYPGLENMIGFFVNTLVLRQKLDFNASIRDFINDVSAGVLRGQIHQDLPFEKLVNALNIEPDSSRHPVFQVMFGFQGGDSGAKETDGKDCFFHPYNRGIQNETSKFDLTMMIDDQGEELCGTFNFATSLFKDSTIKHMISTYQYILEQFSTLFQRGSSEVKLSELRWINSAMPGLHGICSDYDKAVTLHGLFEEQAFRTPDLTALVFGDVRLSYRDLNEKANQLAHYLIQHYDIRPDELIPICFNRSEKMLIGILGILKAGGAYVPLDPGYPVERLGHILNDTGARLILADKQTVSKLHEYVSAIAKNGPVILNLDDAEAAAGIQRCFREDPVTAVRPDHLAYVIYTSGTTGRPKGVMIEHNGVVNLIEQQASILDLEETLYRSEQKNLLWYADYVFDAHVWEVYSVFALGHILHVLPNESRTDLEILQKYIIQHDIKVATIPPALLDKESILPLEKIIVAGDTTNSEIMECYRKYGIDVINAYGPTETTVCATYHHYCEDGNSLNIGRPIGNTSAYVLDFYLRAVPIGAIGELYIGGVGLSRGYLNRPELTAERFLVNPFQTEEEKASNYNGRIYKTGDLVRLLPNGDLEYMGRNDSQLKIRGYRIEPGEIEAVLVGLSGIHKAVVMCRESSLGLKYLTAYYVSDVPFESADISALLSEILPDYMVPSVYVHLNELPLTINGKLDRKSLPEPLFTGETEYVAARTWIEEQLVWIYGEILDLDPDHISIYDDFFRLGGNSIMAIKLIAKIRQDLDMQVNVSAVFDNKSIVELATVLENFTTETICIDRADVRYAEDQLLSFSQEGLWFIDQYKGGNNSYNIPLVCRIDKSVNISILAESLASVMQRHEILRSLILTSNEGIGYQQVTDPYLELTVQEVSSFDALETELSKEAKRIFCLSEEIPLSIRVFSMDDHCYLSIVFHHIAFDGWSVEIFLHELYVIYQALFSGYQYELPTLEFQYKDYALWQRKYLNNTTLKKQLEYWQSYLKVFETLNLPLDFKRPSEISYEGCTISFIIPSQISSDLRSLAKKLGVSLYSVMLSGYYLMLSSYSGQDDIVVGTPFTNRHYQGLENMIGLFVNTLVLRETIDYNTDVRSFIKKVSASVLGAQANQDLPFEKLVNALDIAQDSSRHPIFQVMFGFESFSKTPGNVFKGNSFLHPFEGRVSYDMAKFDITTMIDDTDDVLSGTFNYASCLYAESTIERMKSAYLYFLKQISALHLSGESEIKLSELHLSETEDFNWLSDCNGTYSVYNREATIHSLFERQVCRTPNQTALFYQGIKLTYQELNERSNRLAHYLLEKYKIKPDELIPLCLSRSEQMLIGLLAVLKAGGAFVPLDPSFPSERRKHILPDTGARLIITESASVSKLGYEVSDIICLDDEKMIKELSSCRTDNPETDVKSSNLAYVIYTSGTTGKPKGVMIEHTSVVNLTEEIRGIYNFCETGKFSAYTSYVFDVSVSEFFSALLYGNELHLLDEHTKKDINLVKEYLLTHDITHAYLPPVMLSLLPRCDFPSLQTLMYAGEPGDEETVKYWSLYKNVYNLYGPTEATIYATYKQIRHHDSNPLNIGIPLGNTSVYVLDSYLRQVPIGAVGELYIGGVGVSRGYLNLTELTTERFLANPFQTEKEKASGYNGRIYKTGDLVRILPNGDLEYLGRNDSQIKIRGYRIEPGEIEAALLALNGIRQAVVVCRVNKMGLKYLVAYYVSENPLDSRDISVLLSEVLPNFMVPSAYVHLKTLPVTINGKLDKNSLPEPLFTGETEYVSPQTPLQEQLVEIYGEVLGLDADHISIHDDFFRLGGNSIMVIKLVNKIYQRTGIRATGGMVFNHKSIAGLSRALEGLPEFAVEEISPVIVKHTSEQYLSFGQERLWFIENYEGGSHAYNIPMVFRLDKRVTLRFLEKTFHMLLDRHEILRTLILTDPDGSGYQYVSDQSLELTLVEIGSFEDFREMLSEDMNERFNLREDLPIRVKVLNYEDDYYLSVVFHHIAFDGWSMEIFLAELNSICQSLVLGVLPTLPSLPFQYKDFALWHRKYVTEKVLDKQLEYWLDELSEFETLNLPLDFQRPSRTSYEGKNLYFSLSSKTSSRLRSMSKDLGVSLYSLMLSGYYLMLASYSGQDDLIVGTPVANRHYPGLENMIGFFVNTLVLRQKLDFNASIRDFINDVSAGVLRGQMYQDLPFEKLVDALNVEPDSSRHPVFQVMFGLKFFESGNKRWYGEDCYFHPFNSGIQDETSKFDLTTIIDNQGEELCGTFNFSKSLFKDSTIEDMINTYQYILEQFSSLFQRGSSEVKLSELRWIKEGDGAVSGQHGKYSGYDREATLHGLFEEQAFRTPDLTALVSGDVRLSYRDLNEKANQLAHYLIQHYDIRPDELIPICFNRSEKMLIGILGILKAGGAYVPLDPGYPVERLGHILNDTGARLILAEEQTVSKLHEYVSAIAKKGPAILNLDDADAADGIQKYFRKNPVTEVRSNHLAYVIYTSGTTGMPKGVMIEHSGVVNLVSFMTRSHRFNEYTNVGCYSNYVFDAFVNEVFPVLCHGNTLWLFSNEQRTSVADLNHYIKANGIEVSFIPPVLLKDLLVDTELKLIFAGGESFPDIDRSCYKDIIFLNEYGPTETTVCATVHHYDEEGNPLNIGRPIDNVSVYVLDSYLRPVPIGAVGELYVGGVGVSRGYLNLPELTAERFLANPFQTEEEQVLGYNGRIYKTGDLVRILPNGDLEYLGRNDSQIKIRGYRIEQGEIETALLGLNGIRQAVVECRENSMGLKYLAAYYVSENPLDSGDISVLLSEVLPDYMVPSAYVHLKALPVTINGKIDRKALPEPLFTGETEYVSPQTPLQEQLVEIYGEVLGLDADHISIHDDFFRLGGNSIMAIKLVNKIYQRTGIQPKVIDVFNEKTINKLSWVINHYEPEYKAVIALNHVTDKPRAFMIHPGGAGCEVYKGLAEKLKPYCQCYGVDSYNLYNDEKISNLNDLAMYYLNHIEVIQKASQQEEYILIGWCLGGQIALEIASILESRGHRNITILMLDTILRAEDAKLMELSSMPSDEEISEEFKAPIDSDLFLASKKFALAEHCIVGQKISTRLKFTRMVLLKAMVKGEKENQLLFDHIHQLACNNVNETTAHSDLLMVYPVEASHQEIIKEEEFIIDIIKRLIYNPQKMIPIF